MIYAKQKISFHKLSLHRRCSHRYDRLVWKHHRTLRHSKYISCEAEILKIFKEAFVKNAL